MKDLYEIIANGLNDEDTGYCPYCGLGPENHDDEGNCVDEWPTDRNPVGPGYTVLDEQDCENCIFYGVHCSPDSEEIGKANCSSYQEKEAN